MAAWRAMRISRFPQSATVKIFILLETLLTMLALFEIAGTVYVMFYGPKEHIRETSKILTLIASIFSWNYAVLHWCIFASGRHTAKRSRHPVAILYLCLLCCLWIAAAPGFISKAFGKSSCNGDSIGLSGSVSLTTCRLEKANAVIAGIMAGLSFVLLQFVTCSSQICPRPANPEMHHISDAVSRFPAHHAWTASTSDSQTLRPSHDVDCLPSKCPPSSHYKPQLELRRECLEPLDLSLTLDSHKAQHARGLSNGLNFQFNPHQHDLSQTCLLPSPLQPPPNGLPQEPSRATSLRSHPPLSRSQTVDTLGSSIYSRSISTESLFRREPSPLSAHNKNNPFTTRSPSSPPLDKGSPNRPPTPHSLERKASSAPHPTHSKPPRPDSIPAMPPSKFWLDVCQASSQTHQAPPLPSPLQIRKPSISQTPHAFCDVDTEKHPNGTTHTHQRSYDRLRKGTKSPTCAGKQDLDRRLAAAMDVAAGDLGLMMGEKSKGRKVSKKRQPSGAF